MNAVVRRKIEMAARVRDFLRAHPPEGAGGTAALARFEELLKRAEALAARQQSGVVSSRSATALREELKLALQTRLVRYLVAVGQTAARDNLELAAQFHLPRRGSHQGFLVAVKGMLAKAESQRDLLISRGMSETLLEALTKALGEFEASLEVSRASRMAHVGARADLQAVAGEIVEQVRVLDGLVRYDFGSNPEVMGAWGSARNVVGPFRSKVIPPVEDHPTPGGIAPAA
jgi:hypothetical protein